MGIANIDAKAWTRDREAVRVYGRFVRFETPTPHVYGKTSQITLDVANAGSGSNAQGLAIG
jgi:hypothetical protein